MVQTEILNEGTLIRHYSDQNKVLRQVETGREYSEAVDVVPCAYTYEETEKEIKTEGGSVPTAMLDTAYTEGVNDS